jgi:hypothetical protein
MEEQIVRGHTYIGVVAQDNARAHYGDAYYNGHTNVNFYHSCSTSSQHSSKSLESSGHQIEGRGNELHSLKRKQTSDTYCGPDAESRKGELFSSKRRRIPNDVSVKQDTDKEDSLEYVLNTFGKFSKSIQDQRLKKDAKKLVRRIVLIINAVKRQAATSQGNEQLDGHGRAASHDEDDFENIGNCLLVAERVDINTGCHHIGCTKLVRVFRKRDVVKFGQWEISLSTSSFESRDENGTEIVESLTSVSLNPRTPSAGPPVQILFGKQTNHSAVGFIHPVVLAYRLIPNDSEVFELIEKDDLEGLKELLACGKATLRDCDEYNAGLLTVSRNPILQLRIN